MVIYNNQQLFGTTQKKVVNQNRLLVFIDFCK